MARLMGVVLLMTVPALVAADEKKPAPSYIGVQLGKGKDGAVTILTVIGDGPAKKAGLKGGDIIVRIDGVKPTDLEAMVKVIKALKPGKKAKFEVKRDGKDKTIEVTPVEVAS